MIKDAAGNELKVGHVVAWGAGGKLAHGLRIGEVLEIDTKKHTPIKVGLVRDYGTGGWKRPDQMVRILEPKT